MTALKDENMLIGIDVKKNLLCDEKVEKEADEANCTDCTVWEARVAQVRYLPWLPAKSIRLPHVPSGWQPKNHQV